MKKRLLLTLTAVTITLFGFFLVGCKGETGTQGPQGERGLQGNPGTSQTTLNQMTGYILLTNQFGERLGNQAGSTVRIVGLNRSATTDVNGRYFIDSIPTGTHQVIHFAPGFDTVQIFRSFANGLLTNFGTFFIGQDASFGIIIDSIRFIPNGLSTNNSLIRVSGRAVGISQPNRSVSVVVFWGGNTSVNASPINHLASSLLTIQSGAVAPTNGIVVFSITIFNIETIYRSGIPNGSGAPAFAIAYPVATNSTSFIDLSTGRVIYTGLGSPSLLQSVVFPRPASQGNDNTAKE
jgi:hypothetical protein